MIYILIGKSGSGKDYIQKYLVEKYNLSRIVTHTTRPPRNGEQGGVDYYFVTDSEFEKTAFFERRQYITAVDGHKAIWKYGLSRAECERAVRDGGVIILDLTGAIKLKRAYPDSKIIFIDCLDQTREERAMKRANFNRQEWERRLQTDGQDFCTAIVNADYVVDNGRQFYFTEKQLQTIFGS